MTAAEARALMPRNKPTLETVMATQVYPEIERAAREDADGVSICHVPTQWLLMVSERLCEEGYVVGWVMEKGTLTVQWGGYNV